MASLLLGSKTLCSVAIFTLLVAVPLESRAQPKFSFGEEKWAFWINAYNACTMKIIVDHYPLQSITNIKPWKKKLCRVGRKDYSLDHIEHDILRHKLQESKIHFAINCAAKSCPIIRGEAYTALKLKAQLEDQLKVFLSDSSKNNFYWDGKVLYLSKIFDWYRKDFERERGSVLNYLSPYFTAEQREWIQKGEVTIKYMDYEWDLNAKE